MLDGVTPFPAEFGLPDFHDRGYDPLWSILQETGITILNHPRDLYSDFRPFGPEHFNPVSGELPQAQESGSTRLR